MGNSPTPSFFFFSLLDFTSIKHNSDRQGRHFRITFKVVLNIQSFLTTPGEGLYRWQYQLVRWSVSPTV